MPFLSLEAYKVSLKTIISNFMMKKYTFVLKKYFIMNSKKISRKYYSAIRSFKLKNSSFFFLTIMLITQLSYSQEDVKKDSKNKVRIANLSKKSLGFSRAVASKFSMGKGNTVILYNGTDKELMKQVHAGLTDAAKDGAPIKAMVIGPRDPNQQPETFIIYVAGTPLDSSFVIDATIGDARKLAKAAVSTHKNANQSKKK
jgi:hypothetical protein